MRSSGIPATTSTPRSRIRTYSELAVYPTLDERFEYLNLSGKVGVDTFGADRYINQRFYRSREWKRIRDHVIARDEGCDLGIPGFEIFDKVIIHHMNPMSVEDIVSADDDIINPEYLITTTHRTHNAIHYGNDRVLRPVIADRKPGDTRLW